MTPEGRVKKKIKKLLDSYDTNVYTFMPVQTGFGRRTVDYLLCVDGLFVGVEAKAKGAKPTDLQNDAMKAIRAAGGSVFVVDDDASLEMLDNFIYMLIHKRRRSSGEPGC